MRKTLLRLAVLGAVAAVPAYAQVAPTTPDRSATDRTAPPAARRDATPGTTAPAPATTAPGMTTPDAGSGATTTNPRTESTRPEAPLAGANSFTEGQARSRIEAAGFTGVNELQKDDQGIWRGRAMRNGQQVSVALDYQGNVTTR